MKKVLIAALVGVTAVALSSCGIGKDPLATDGGGSAEGAIVIGSADFPRAN